MPPLFIPVFLEGLLLSHPRGSLGLVPLRFLTTLLFLGADISQASARLHDELTNSWKRVETHYSGAPLKKTLQVYQNLLTELEAGGNSEIDDVQHRSVVEGWESEGSAAALNLMVR